MDQTETWIPWRAFGLYNNVFQCRSTSTSHRSSLFQDPFGSVGLFEIRYGKPGECTCHDRDRTYPYTPYPDLSTPIPSHLNHSRAPNTKPEPSDPLASQQRTPEHSDPLASSQRIPDPTHPRPLLFLASSRFPTNTLVPDPTPFDLHSFASNLFPTFHRSRDCGRAKPDCVPPSLDAS